MSDSVKKWHEMQECAQKPIIGIQTTQELNALTQLVKTEMENAYTLQVPPKLSKPIVSIEKKEIYDAFIYNLNCYDAKIIDREEFINAMEDYIYG
jgi:hypothetical protein